VNARQSPRRTGAFRPRIEALEDRSVPAVTSLLGAGVLIVTGDQYANDVSIVQDDDANTLQVRVVHSGGTDTYHYTSSAVYYGIVVDLKGGDDDFYYGLEPGTAMTKAKEADITLGGGDDEARLDFLSPGSMHGADLSIDLTGGNDVDTLDADFGFHYGSTIDLSADMGAGDDTADVRMTTTSVGNFSHVTFALQGGAGNDTLLTECGAPSGSTLTIDANSSLVIDVEGDAGDDRITTGFSGRVGGDLTVLSWGDDDRDTIRVTVDLLNSPIDGDVDVRSYGQYGNDTLTQRVRNVGFATLSAHVNGGPGTDVVYKTFNVIHHYAEWVTYVT
jgi:hypothetical protein